MFDLNKLGDMAKMANQAKEMHSNQDRFQRDQMDVLNKISWQLDSILSTLKESAQNRG